MTLTTKKKKHARPLQNGGRVRKAKVASLEEQSEVGLFVPDVCARAASGSYRPGPLSLLSE